MWTQQHVSNILRRSDGRTSWSHMSARLSGFHAQLWWKADCYRFRKTTTIHREGRLFSGHGIALTQLKEPLPQNTNYFNRFCVIWQDFRSVSHHCDTGMGVTSWSLNCQKCTCEEPDSNSSFLKQRHGYLTWSTGLRRPRVGLGTTSWQRTLVNCIHPPRIHAWPSGWMNCSWG